MMTHETIKKTWQEALRGKYALPREMFDADVQDRILPIEDLNAFVPTEYICEQIVRLNKVLTNISMEVYSDYGQYAIPFEARASCNVAKYLRKYNNIALNLACEGKPGTGKTQALQIIATALQMPVTTELITHDTTVEHLFGCVSVDDQGNVAKIRSDSQKILDGGGIVIYDEFNALATSRTSCLNDLLDTSFVYTAYHQDVKIRNPYCVIAIAMNVGIVGRSALDTSIMSRYYVKHFDTINEDKKVEMVCKTSGCSAEFAKWVLTNFDAMMNNIMTSGIDDADEMMQAITVRNCTAVAKDAVIFGTDPKEAFINCTAQSLALMSPMDCEAIMKWCKQFVGNFDGKVEA